jgi:CheY-like chemotaxis protein
MALPNIHGAQGKVSATAEIAHELRAPLGGIEAMAKLLSETGLTPEQQRIVAGLSAAAAHLRGIANDILDETALDAGHFRFDERELDLRAFLNDLAVSACARATTKGLSFKLNIADAVSQGFIADGRRIRQMLENLLDNAMKVTEHGSVMLDVEPVDRRGAFEGIRFCVRDTGPGLAPDQQAKLFRSFGRADNGVAGTGIGLSLVKRLSNAMGGEAGCDSAPGAGATFWFTLRLKAADAGSGQPEAVAAPARASLPLTGGRILVVDDNHANRMIMGAVLEHFGFDMAEAASAEQALSMVATGRFNAVLMDQTLPGMSGLEALRMIRSMPAPVNSLPVIPVTGRVSRSDRDAFAAAGANGFVEKPVTASALRDALADAMNG